MPSRRCRTTRRPAASAGPVAEHLRQPRLPVVPRRAALPPDATGWPASWTCASRSGKDFPKSHSAYWELRARLGRHRDRVHLEADRAADRPRGAATGLRGARRAAVGRNHPGNVNRGRRTVPSDDRGPSAIDAGRRCEQRRPTPRRGSGPHAARPTHATDSGPRKVHLLFGSPATCERPVALRPRLATGLPLSVGRRRRGRR